MTVSNQIGLVAVVFVLWYVVSSLACWYRLRHVPGPKVASFSYLWVMSKALRGRAMDYEQLSKYGSLVRVGPNYIVTGDPNVFRHVNSARSLANRDAWYASAKLGVNDNLLSSMVTGPHDKLKAKAAHAYGGRDNMDFEVGVDTQVMYFIDIIRATYLSSAGQVKPIDFAQFIRYFTLDIITELGFGKKAGFMDNVDLYGYTSSVENVVSLVAMAADIPLLRRIFILSALSRFFVPKTTDSAGIGKLMGIAEDIVQARFEKNDESHQDMIASFIRHGMAHTEISGELVLQILAGSDTTATAIRCTMLHIISCPRVYQRLKAEVKEAVGSGRASFPIANEEAKMLPYLQAVILEGIRMRPPAIYGLYKKIPSGGDTINGKFIPGGTAVGWNGPAMMRLESIFGQDAQVFRPERFLECDEAKKHEMERTVDLVFGYGRWMCAGKTLALIELNKVFFELMRAFDWQLIYPGRAWKETAFSVWVHRDMWVSITEAEDL